MTENEPGSRTAVNLSGYTVKRLWINPAMSKDCFAIIEPGGGLLANVAYDVAHAFILGKLPPEQLQNQAENGVFLV